MNKHEDNHQRINGVRVRDIRDPGLKKAKGVRAFVNARAMAKKPSPVFDARRLSYRTRRAI